MTPRAARGVRIGLGAAAALALLCAVKAQSGRAPARLSAAAFTRALPKTDAETVVLPDAKLYTRGLYSAYAAPFSSEVDRSLRRGPDYLDTITIQPSTFPNHTLFDVRWPARQHVPTGVWGYHALSFGNYGGGPVDTLIPPRQAGAIRELSSTFDYVFTGSANFNLLTEFFLTSRPGDAGAKVSEIGFLLHVPPATRAFMRRGETITDFTDRSGIAWRITRVGTYFMVAPVGERILARGTVDYAAVIRLLIAKGQIRSDSWFNGLAFGAEPTIGGGRTRLYVRRWQVRFR